MKTLTKQGIDELKKQMPVLSEQENRAVVAGSSCGDYNNGTYQPGATDKIYEWYDYATLYASGNWGGGFVNWGHEIVYMLPPAVVNGSGNNSGSNCGNYDPWNDNCGNYGSSGDYDNCGNYTGCGNYCGEYSNGGGGSSVSSGNPQNGNGNDDEIYDVFINNFPIPESVQLIPGECLPNCVTQLLQLFGNDTNLNTIALEMFKMGWDPINGVHFNNVQNILQQYFNIESINTNDPNEFALSMINALMNGNPLISLIPDPQDPNGLHSVVITRIRFDENDNITLHYYDPYFNEEQIAVGDIGQFINDVIIIKEK